jgi:hypothetical protein
MRLTRVPKLFAAAGLDPSWFGICDECRHQYGPDAAASPETWLEQYLAEEQSLLSRQQCLDSLGRADNLGCNLQEEEAS